MAVFGGENSTTDVVNNGTMSHDEVVASDVPPWYLILVACTRLYKSLCRSVRRSVHRSVTLNFFCVFKQFEGSKVRPTNGLTDTMTYRVACTQLMAIGLVDK